MKTTTWESHERTTERTSIRVLGKRRKRISSTILEALGVSLMVIFSLAVFKISGFADGLESPLLRVIVGTGITFWIVSSFRTALHHRVRT